MRLSTSQNLNMQLPLQSCMNAYIFSLALNGTVIALETIFHGRVYITSHVQSNNT